MNILSKSSPCSCSWLNVIHHWHRWLYWYIFHFFFVFVLNWKCKQRRKKRHTRKISLKTYIQRESHWFWVCHLCWLVVTALRGTHINYAFKCFNSLKIFKLKFDFYKNSSETFRNEFNYEKCQFLLLSQSTDVI